MIDKSSPKASYIRHISKCRPLGYLPIWLLGIAIVCIALPAIVGAEAFISQSYSTGEQLPLGSIVGLQTNFSDRVVASTTSNVDGIFGVVINAASSPIALQNGQDNQVQVATSGTLQVLVSNINGTISRGDHITASPIKGVGMRASSNVRIIGIAQGNLVDTGTKQSYTDQTGKAQSVIIGEVPIMVNVAYYFREPDKTIIPSAMQNVANAFAGKPVSALPIVISAAIFLITIVVVSSIVFSMIRSSIISVGRNPMSQSAVYRDVIQLSGLVLVLLGAAFVAMYLVLTRL